MAQDMRNKSSREGLNQDEEVASGGDMFTMVHYSTQFNYLSDIEFQGEHVQLTGIQFTPKIVSFSLTFDQCTLFQQKNQIASARPFLQQMVQSRRKIVQVIGQNDGSLSALAILLPLNEKRKVVGVTLKSKSKVSSGFLSNRKESQLLELYDQQGNNEYSMNYKLFLIGSAEEEEKKQRGNNHQFSFQRLEGTSSLEEEEGKRKVENESGKKQQSRQLGDESGKVESGEVEGGENYQNSENQFLPDRDISKEFSFKLIQGAQDSMMSQDEEEDLPIREPHKNNHEFPSLLRQAITHSNASRKKKSKNSPQDQLHGQSNEERKEKAEICSNRFQFKEEARQMQRYRELSQRKQISKSQQKEKVSPAQKYDFKPKDTILKSQKQESIEIGDQVEEKPKHYKTPLAVDQNKKIQPTLKSLQSTPTSKLRGFTDKIYLKRFMRSSIIKNKEEGNEGRQKSPEQSLGTIDAKIDMNNKEQRKPGFICSHRLKLESLREHTEIQRQYEKRKENQELSECQGEKNREEAKEQRGNLSLIKHLQRIRGEQSQDGERQTKKEESREEKGLPSNSRLQKPSRSTSKEQIRSRKQSKHLKLNSNNLHLSVTRTNKHLDLSRHLIDLKIEKKHPKISLQKVLNQSYIPLIEHPAKDHSASDEKNKYSIIAKYQSNTSNVYPTESQQIRESRHRLPQPICKAVSEQEEEAEVSFDILISNLSVNLYSKSFGRKFVELSLGQTLYSTDFLHGSHLLWVGRGYLFTEVTAPQSIEISLKCEKDDYLKILGKAKISIGDLLLNHRQSFCQSYLFTPNSQLLAVVILGFEISTHRGVRRKETPQRHGGSKTAQKSKTKGSVLGKTRRQPLLHQFLDQSLGQGQKFRGQKGKGIKESRLVTDPAFESISVRQQRMMTEMCRPRRVPRDN